MGGEVEEGRYWGMSILRTPFPDTLARSQADPPPATGPRGHAQEAWGQAQSEGRGEVGRPGEEEE